VDLLHGDRVEPALDDGPNGAETPGGVDEVEAAKALGVVVLRHGAGLLDVAEHLGRLHQANALEVHDSAAGLEEKAGLAAAGGQAGVRQALVLDGKVREHALGGGDLVHGVKIDATELLDIDGATILWVGEKPCESTLS